MHGLLCSQSSTVTPLLLGGKNLKLLKAKSPVSLTQVYINLAQSFLFASYPEIKFIDLEYTKFTSSLMVEGSKKMLGY